MSTAEVRDPRLPAAIDLVGRTGARSIQVRYSDDEEPTVWMALADYGAGRYEIDAALSPTAAVLRLAERLIDGGQCLHCHKPTALNTDFTGAFLESHLCWWQWDPELAKFRRGCEGE